MHANTTLTVPTVQPLLQQLFPKAAGLPHIAPLAADASTRRYFRIHWHAPTAGCPVSCVMMVCAPWQPQETPDFLAVGRHLRRHGVRVPEVYGVAPLQGLMCLEDYGDCTLAKQWQDELDRRFHLPFEIMTNDGLEAARSGNWFSENPLAVCRLDKLSRDVKKASRKLGR